MIGLKATYACNDSRMTLIARRNVLTGLMATLATPALAMNIHVREVSHIQVLKSARRLDLVGTGRVLKHYDIRLGRRPFGPKQIEGDGKTPEGAYRINRRNAASQYHLSLGISYPNRSDVVAARAKEKSAGGAIVIHGQPNGLKRTLQRDWTLGCIALANEDIEELWRVVEIGCPIMIHP